MPKLLLALAALALAAPALAAPALAAPPAPPLEPGQKLALVATLEGCTAHVAARARGERRKIRIGGEVVRAEGRGVMTWSGPPPDGEDSSDTRLHVYATAGRAYAETSVHVAAPTIGPLTVDGAPLPEKVDGYADIAPVVVARVEHPCAEGLVFHVAGPRYTFEVRPVDGELRVPLREGFGRVSIEARWHGYEVGEPIRFMTDVEPPRPCLDDDGDGLSDCAGDCRDGDPHVRPGLPEVWWDGKDNDCDGVRAGNADGDRWDAAGRVPRVNADGVRMLEALYGPIRARRLARDMQQPDYNLSEQRAFDCDDADPAVGPAPSPDPWDPGCTIARPGPRDDDGDGYAKECADDDPTRHPRAPEVANGFDDDCDGAIDEGVAAPDTDDTSLAAPRWLGLLDLPATHRFVLSDRDVDAYAFALRPLRSSGAEHRVEVDTGGGEWNLSLYGAPATGTTGLDFMTDGYGSRTQIATARIGGTGVFTSGGGSLLGLTTRLLKVLPFEAAVPAGVMLLPAAAVADGQAPAASGPAPTPSTATVAAPTPEALPADAYVYVVVITRDRGPGGLAELRVWEEP